MLAQFKQEFESSIRIAVNASLRGYKSGKSRYVHACLIQNKTLFFPKEIWLKKFLASKQNPKITC